eukprot:jgi/Ulvmu1/10163/UM006_0117.1
MGKLWTEAAGCCYKWTDLKLAGVRHLARAAVSWATGANRTTGIAHRGDLRFVADGLATLLYLHEELGIYSRLYSWNTRRLWAENMVRDCARYQLVQLLTRGHTSTWNFLKAAASCGMPR